MGVIKVMGSSGHSQAVWDVTAAEAGNQEAAAAFKEAERIFQEARGRRLVAFKVNPETGSGEKIEHFDRYAEEIVMVPQLAGG